MSDFLPQGYETPKSENKNYLKLKEPGSHDIRILSSPIIGWVQFDQNNKPQRTQGMAPPTPIVSGKQPEFFWAMIVWHYATRSVMIWETRSKAMIRGIEDLVKNPKWGSPIGYDLTISRKGTTKETTEYSVVPSPHTPVPYEAGLEFGLRQIQLQALWTGNDPFATPTSAASVTPLLAGAKFTEPQPQAAPQQAASPIPPHSDFKPNSPQPSAPLDGVQPEDGDDLPW